MVWKVNLNRMMETERRKETRMTEYERCWELLRRRDLESVPREAVANCARILAELIPQDYRAGKIITDLGEVWACTILAMTRMPEQNRGYDAIDEKGVVDRKGLRYQIKTRSPQKGDRVNEAGTVGKFTNFDFDGALLILLDKGLQVYDLCVVERQILESRLRTGRNDITIAKFKVFGRCLPG